MCLHSFIPNLSAETEALRGLTKLHVEFEWTRKHQTEYDAIKQMLSSPPVLKIFDGSKPIVVQTDALKSGIGACLLQEKKPVAYASRALTPIETMYVPIEKELLAIVFGLERFHTYVYGATVTVVTDHRPLVTIANKPFARVSARLQRLKLRLLKYRFAITYLPGREKCTWLTHCLGQ